MRIVLVTTTGRVYHARDVPEIRLLSRAPNVISWRGMTFVLAKQGLSGVIVYQIADQMTLSDDYEKGSYDVAR